MKTSRLVIEVCRCFPRELPLLSTMQTEPGYSSGDEHSHHSRGCKYSITPVSADGIHIAKTSGPSSPTVMACSWTRPLQMQYLLSTTWPSIAFSRNCLLAYFATLFLDPPIGRMWCWLSVIRPVSHLVGL